MIDIVILSAEQISSKFIKKDNCFDLMKYQVIHCNKMTLSFSSKTVPPEVHGEGVEGDDCDAGHLRQEGGEPVEQDARDLLKHLQASL